MSIENQFIVLMATYREQMRIWRREEQAIAAMKVIVNQEKIDIKISNMGSHCGLWVIWEGNNGSHYARQFSWSRENPGHDGLRLQWIYDAIYDAESLRWRNRLTTPEEWAERVERLGQEVLRYN